MVAKEKQSAVADKKSATEAGICFSCNINEQTSDEVGQRARQREFASLG